MRTWTTWVLLALAGRSLAAEINLAAGRPCAFSPAPNYALTAKGGTDSTDLTDGRLSARSDQRLWFEAVAVAWSHRPVVAFQIDLGQVQPIAAVVIRWLGGSGQPGIDFPTFVRVLVSDDEVSYVQVAEYSRWRPEDDRRFGVPATAGEAWIHPLRFADLRTRGRYVGFVVGGTGLLAADEVMVYGGTHDPASVSFAPAQVTDFSVRRPLAVFVKPALVLTRPFATPQPLALLDGSGRERPVTFCLETPAGVEVAAGAVGGTKVDTATITPRPDGGRLYEFSATVGGEAVMPWGKPMVRASLPDGSRTSLRYWLDWGEGSSIPVTIPATVAEIPPAPRCQRLMLALGWWSLAETMAWPEGLTAARAIGLNTLSTFTMWMDPTDQALWQFAAEARQQGFKMLNVDSTWHRMLSRHAGDPSLFCQFADGTTGTRFCPSYRGPAYAEELERVADQCARLKPDYLSADVELWNWQGPVDAERCTRCQADRQAAGIATWEEWKLAKGYEMWRDLNRTVQARVAAAGGPAVEIGCYDWRPGRDYQYFWPFDRLYAEGLLGNSQVSTYTPLLPYHIELVGDEARADRSRLPRTAGLPWLCPGDAGAFTAEALRCALLECFLNGSRGIHFWSNRYWDGESFLGYNQAVRAVAAVEDIIVDGQLYARASTARPARVSGMIRGHDLALLVGEYYGREPVTVRVALEVPVASDLVDAASGETLRALPPGAQELEVGLDTHRSQVLWVRPR